MEVNSNNGADLSRQVTYSLTQEQYERLFFQPSAAKGDLAKRLGNPTLLGLCGFLIPFTTVVMSAMQWRGTDSSSLVGFSGAFYFLGGIAMNIAGICEFILGNTFPFAVFVIYGSHWCNVAYTFDPAHNLISAYGKAPDNAVSMAYNSGQAMYNIVMMLISFVFFLGSLRTNAPFAIAIFFLIFLFAFFAASDWKVAYSGGDPVALARAAYYLQIAGGFGFITAIMGWYLAIITACASTGLPCPLPIFDLSTKIANHSKAEKLEHAGSVRVPGANNA